MEQVMKNDSFRIKIDVKSILWTDGQNAQEQKKSKFKGLRPQVKCCFLNSCLFWEKFKKDSSLKDTLPWKKIVKKAVFVLQLFFLKCLTSSFLIRKSIADEVLIKESFDLGHGNSDTLIPAVMKIS